MSYESDMRQINERLDRQLREAQAMVVRLNEQLLAMRALDQRTALMRELSYSHNRNLEL